jgi:5-methylcytosine-specific restriction endonuclease McrA
MRGKRANLNLEIIKSMYLNDKLGTPYIAKYFSCSSNTINRFLKKNNIPVRPQKESATMNRGVKPKTFTDDMEKQIANEYLQYGENFATLADKYKCHKVVILRAIKRHGVKTKSRKESLGDKFKGENNPNYGNHYAIAGESNIRWIKDRGQLKRVLREAIRKSHQHTMWRRSIFKRDDFTCVLCKKRGCNLEAHHLIPMRDIIRSNNIKTYDEAMACEDMFDLDNGVTMCRECHDKTKWKEHKYYNEIKEAIRL